MKNPKQLNNTNFYDFTNLNNCSNNENEINDYYTQKITEKYKKFRLSLISNDISESVPESLKNLNLCPGLFVKIKNGSIQEQYKFGKQLGQGSFGQVFLVLHKSLGIKRALKVINKSEIIYEDHSNFFYEMHILKEIDHPNIVKILELFEDEKRYYLISEYFDGGNIFDKIKDKQHFSEKDIKLYMNNIFSAINYCHNKNIVHRDIKPENLLFDSKSKNAKIKLIDFGASKVIHPGEFLTKRIGTPHYVAPEVLKKKYNEKCDIWSCGVLLYIMLFGSPPFNGKTVEEIFQNIEAQKFEINLNKWKKISNESKSFLNKLLEYDFSKRISAKEALEDPWFKSNEENSPIKPKVLENLANFHEKNKFRSTILTFIASQIISNEEKKELTKTFVKLDKDKNGTLSKQELINGYSMLYGNIELAKLKVDSIMKEVDFNNSGEIDFTEFIVASIEKEKILNKELITKAFGIFDLVNFFFINRIKKDLFQK